MNCEAKNEVRAKKRKENQVRGTCRRAKAGEQKKKLIATYGTVLLVFEVLSDGKYILPRATQVTRQDVFVCVREQVGELPNLA